MSTPKNPAILAALAVARRDLPGPELAALRPDLAGDDRLAEGRQCLGVDLDRLGRTEIGGAATDEQDRQQAHRG